MSKVFSAKRKEVEFEYEFLGGKRESLVARSLSTKEQKKISKLMKNEENDVSESFKEIISMQLATNDKDIVKKVVDEQYEEGDIVEFSNSLNELIREEKAKK